MLIRGRFGAHMKQGKAHMRQVLGAYMVDSGLTQRVADLGPYPLIPLQVGLEV